MVPVAVDQLLQSTINKIGFVSQTHELREFFHQRRVEILAHGQELRTMLLAVGTKVPFLDFGFSRIRFDTCREDLRVPNRFLESTKMLLAWS